jgi:SAM-dependent methyltransferase
MHAAVFSAFDAICRAEGAAGAVLEVGAMPAPDSLLMLPALAGTRERIGINLRPASEIGGCSILQADAHDMACFASGRFDVVLCNSVLEHDPRFWLSLAEMRRVAKPGALIVIGVPGYAAPGFGAWRRQVSRAARLPVLGRALAGAAAAYLAGTPVLRLHNHPGDYYRFSEQACREILMAGLEQVRIRQLLQPPRFVAWGRMPVL